MDTKQTPTLKPMPISVTKTRLEKMYEGQLPSSMFRRSLNEIIYDNRKKIKGYELLTRKQIIGTHIVLRAEIKEFAATYDLPFGFYLPENY